MEYLGTVYAFRFAVLALAIAAADRACAQSLNIDYDASRVEIRGEAFGFIPAMFWFREFEADIVTAESGGALLSSEFRFSYLELTSGRMNRDRKIRRWLEAERFPEGQFVLERLVERGGKRVAIGQLRLHGVNREAEFVYSIDKEGGDVRLSIEALIDYRDWGLPPLKALFFSVGPDVKIRIDVRGTVDASG